MADEAALDQLLNALDDDPLLNEALGRTPGSEQKKRQQHEEEERRRKEEEAQKELTAEQQESLIFKQKVAAGFSSYDVSSSSQANTTSLSAGGGESSSLVVDPNTSTGALFGGGGGSRVLLPHGGKLEPLRKKEKPKKGHLPKLDPALASGLKGLSQKPSLAALGGGAEGNSSGTPSPSKSVGLSPAKQQRGETDQDELTPPDSAVPFDSVQMMPFAFAREITSQGGIAPKKRWGHSVHTYGDILYTFGGNVESGGSGAVASEASGEGSGPGAGAVDVSSDFFSLDLKTRIWDTVFCSKGSTPRPRAQHAAAVSEVHGKLLVHGGNGPQGLLLGDLHWYDFVSEEWEALHAKGSKFPSERADHTATIIGDTLYLFGGRIPKKSGGGSTVCSELWSLNLNKMKWKQIKTNSKSASSKKGEAEEATAAPASTTDGGGDDEDLSILENAAMTQATKNNHPPKRAGHAACAVGSWLIIHGGETSGGSYLSDTWAFNTSSSSSVGEGGGENNSGGSNGWVQLDDGVTFISGQRYRHQLFAAGPTLVAIGGITQYQGDRSADITSTSSSSLQASSTAFASTMNLTIAPITAAATEGVVGEQASSSSSSSWVLAPTSRWMPLKISGHTSPGALRGFGAARHNGFLCLFGGAVAGKAVVNNIKRILLTDGIPEAKTTAEAHLIHDLQQLLHDATSSSASASTGAGSDAGTATSGLDVPTTSSSSSQRSKTNFNTGAALVDIRMECRGKVFSAHRSVLALRCPKFLEAISKCHNNNLEPKGVPIYGLEGNKRVQGLEENGYAAISPEQLSGLLEYAYTGRVRVVGTKREGNEGEAMRSLFGDVASNYNITHLAQCLEECAGDAAVASEVGKQLLMQDLKEFCDSTTNVSVTLMVSDPHGTEQVSVVCNHLVLMIRSPFFRRLLRPLFVEGKNVVEMDGAAGKLLTSRRGKRAEVSLSLPVASIRPVLRYLYHGDDKVPPEAALPVMITANKLKLFGLQAICESMVARDEVTQDSACAMVKMAMKYEAHHLYEHALLVAAYCFTDAKISQQDTFQSLPDEVREEIERAAKEIAGKVVNAPAPATEQKDKAFYTAQFERASQRPGGQ